MKKRSAVFAVAVLVLAVGGFCLFRNQAKASFLGDFYDKYLRSFLVFPEKQGENPVPELYGPTDAYENAVVKAVEKASPSVVSIVVSKDLPILEQCLYDPFNGFFRGDSGWRFTVPCFSADKTEKREIGGGTGFVVSEDGLVITNNHVVEDTEAEYTVILNNAAKETATVLARDADKDLALIRIPATGLAALPLADSETVRPGQTAIAIGNALAEFENTVSVGVVSGLARNVTAKDGQTGRTITIDNVIQTDAAINPGNSGGPLLNLKAEVIGINTAIVSGAENIGFAIPANKAKAVMAAFLEEQAPRSE
jgi:S1-C subfamily serine protease